MSAGILELVEPHRDDVLLICGSLAEGLGTTKSDIDLFHVSASKDGDFGRASFDELAGVPVDLEAWTFEEVEILLQRLARVDAAHSGDPRWVLDFSIQEREFFHRFAKGVPIHGEARFAELKRDIPRDVLARLIVDRGLIRVSTAHRDLMGAIECGEHENAVVSLQTIAGYAIDILLGCMGETNPQEKWRLAKLARHKASPGEFLTFLNSLHRKSDIVLDLKRVALLEDVSSTQFSVMNAARTVLPLANLLCLFSQMYLSRNLEFAFFQLGDDRQPDALGDGGAICFRLDVQLRFEDGCYYLKRIGSREALEINAISLAIICMLMLGHDLHVVAAFLEARGSMSQSEIARSIDDLITVLEHGSFLA
ncbi:MAG: hypothetical protein QNJ15_11025 [Erythrobacter sp.]|nr:hypothetical protein [Erythrobacter sp.]